MTMARTSKIVGQLLSGAERCLQLTRLCSEVRLTVELQRLADKYIEAASACASDQRSRRDP